MSGPRPDHKWRVVITYEIEQVMAPDVEGAIARAKDVLIQRLDRGIGCAVMSDVIVSKLP